jgi:myosin-1
MRDRYWHNMAGRIQRAWRNYWRYKNACATRIQRFWRDNNAALAHAQVREYGHTLLAARKERRRFSLVGARRFLGDYLGVASGSNRSPLGGVLSEPCAFAAAERVLLSSRIQLLVSKLGRSSKPSPRYLVLVRSFPPPAARH